MSKNSESKIYQIVREDLKKHDYQLISEDRVGSGRIDVLAQKGNYVFAIEIKNRPLETFDIIRSSTIPMSLKEHPDFKMRNIMSVVTTSSEITEEAKDLGKRTGVIVTQPLNLADAIELVLKNSKGRVKARRKA